MKETVTGFTCTTLKDHHFAVVQEESTIKMILAEGWIIPERPKFEVTIDTVIFDNRTTKPLTCYVAIWNNWVNFYMLDNIRKYDCAVMKEVQPGETVTFRLADGEFTDGEELRKEIQKKMHI